MSKIRDEKTKEAFVEYLAANPKLRFWQAIRNFWGTPYVLTSEDGLNGQDTFYIEADKKYE